MDWFAMTKAARAAFGQSVNDWIVASYVQGGWVRGPDAGLTPGSLKSGVDIEQRLAQTLTSGASPPPSLKHSRESLVAPGARGRTGFN